jgi:uncharacterized membrane protein
MGAVQSSEQEASQALHQLAGQVSSPTTQQPTPNNNAAAAANVAVNRSVPAQNSAVQSTAAATPSASITTVAPIHAAHNTVQSSHSNTAVLVPKITSPNATAVPMRILAAQQPQQQQQQQQHTQATPARHTVSEIAANFTQPQSTPAKPAVAATVTVPAQSTLAAAPSSAKAQQKNSSRGQNSDLLYALVEWASPLLPVGVALAWNEQVIEETVLAISQSDKFKQILTEKAAERRKKRRAEAASRQAASHTGQQVSNIFTETVDPVFSAQNRVANAPANASIAIPYDLAERLLNLDKHLSAVRLSFVPSKVNETSFWYEYFGLVVDLIIQHVLQAQQQIRAHTIQAEHADQRVRLTTR